MKVEATPWRTLLALAAAFGVAPAEFWRLSLREWRALAAPSRRALSRDEFGALSQLYPDANE